MSYETGEIRTIPYCCIVLQLSVVIVTLRTEVIVLTVRQLVAYQHRFNRHSVFWYFKNLCHPKFPNL